MSHIDIYDVVAEVSRFLDELLVGRDDGQVVQAISGIEALARFGFILTSQDLVRVMRELDARDGKAERALAPSSEVSDNVLELVRIYRSARLQH